LLKFVHPSFQYYAESHAVIYIIDSSDKERLEESKSAFGKDFVSFLTYIILQDCMSVRDIRQVLRESAHLLGRRDCHMLGASALRGDGIHDGIEWLVECVKRNIVRPAKRLDDS
ncbi:ADP-ribosylation factor-related protein 1-like, partial [Limulus polyphemus]|uniref:ADP-ribosylation factor-related protein 1-like n=1 Tax=Limulus polyphemus TaxID=6850 RepID=A0ABM1T9C7_LIMPO